VKTRLLLACVIFVALLTLAASCPETEPPNQKPNASFTCSPTSGDSPLVVAFDAGATSDSDGTVLVYAWSFGDGSSGSGATTSHTYSTTTTRTYTARLSVTDNDGATDSTTRAVTVFAGETPPDPTPTPPSGPCNCSGPDLNCSDFSTHAAAQACYDYCRQQGYGDVFRLDGDSDGIACESLP